MDGCFVLLFFCSITATGANESATVAKAWLFVLLFHGGTNWVILEQDIVQGQQLNNFGYLLRTLGRYQEARQYLERALAIRKEQYGMANAYVAITLSHLARIAHMFANYDTADTLYQQAFAINQYLSPLHPDRVRSLTNLGMLAFDRGDRAAARAYVEHAIRDQSAGVGVHHRQTARSLNHLGIIATAEGSVDEALQLFQQAYAIRADLLGLEHPNTANTVSHLGMLALARGDHSTAHTHIHQALAVHQKQLGSHPHTARSLLRAGLVARVQHDTTSAQQLLHQALLMYEHCLGLNHPHTQTARAAQ